MKIAGQNFEVYIDDVKVGDARDCTLNVSQSLFDSTSKDDDNYITRGASFGEWSVDATVVFDETNSFDVVDALDLIIGATKVDIRFDGGSGTHWTGSAYVSNSSVNGPMADVATGTTTFTGDGELFARTWYLPSKDLLSAAITQLKTDGVLPDSIFWSSSESSATQAWAYNDVAEDMVATNKSTTGSALPVRHFTASGYSAGDTSDAGYYIVYVDGTTCYESYYSFDNQGFDSVAFSNLTSTAITGTGTAIGTGFANTLKIIAQTGHTASAAQSCYNL